MTILEILKTIIFYNFILTSIIGLAIGVYVFRFINEIIIKTRLVLIKDNSTELLEKLNESSNALIVVIGQMRSGKTALMNWHASKCDFAYKKANFYSDNMDSWLSAYDFQLDKPRMADDNLTCLYVDEMGLFFRAVEFSKVRKKYKGQAHLVKVSGHIDYKCFFSGQSLSDIWCEPRRVANVILRMTGVKEIGYSYFKKKTYYLMECVEVEGAFFHNPQQGEITYRIIIDDILLKSYDTKWLKFLKLINQKWKGRSEDKRIEREKYNLICFFAKILKLANQQWTNNLKTLRLKDYQNNYKLLLPIKI